ncbi:succinyl-diaminopimelate desuccinylase [Helicobacter cynogastricus]|uniref:succinyl-diaminopimelate desuccinylase n=1 Tax=Helicobacter cynogastricus TaxID=329937 RepID=UPI000CF0A329|nr:succinyl-diaminopimelate desuccinylase [Helicobacter cynogastricus]
MNVVELTQKLLTYPTITPKEEGIFECVCTFLGDFKMLRADCYGVSNVFFYKRFGDPTLEPLHFCFGGHIDVVPAGKGWKHDPFGGVIKDNMLYGRGAQDMKGGVGAFLSALRAVCDQLTDNPPPLLLSVLLTSDEEGEARFGTKYMLEVLQEKNLLPHYALVAEPTCMQALGDSVKIGRRGSIGGKIIVQGIPGHVAYPKTCLNPINLIADKLNLIADAHLDKASAYFEPSRLVITSLKSVSEASNMTPQTLEICFNVRHSPQVALEDVAHFLDVVLEKVPCNIALKQNSLPFLSAQDSPLVAHIQSAIAQILKRTPCLNTQGGTSDARFFAACGVEVVEFGLLNSHIHSLDECVCLQDLQQLQGVFVALLQLIIKEAYGK